MSEVAGLLVKGAAVNSLDGFTPQSPFAAPTPYPNSLSGIAAVNPKAPTYVTIPAANIMTKDVPQGARIDESVAIDRRLNAVVLTGTPEEIAHFKQIISYVDVPTPSVLLECEIVELTEQAAHNLGIDFSANGQPLASASMALNTGSVASSSVALHATLSALASKGAAKILARPRILTLNARTAAILSGEAVPIINTVIVPSGASTIVENQTQYINVGVSLQILPRVAAEGRVTTQVFSEVSSIIDYIGNAPRIAVRQALTSGIVSDGESLLVGGLMQQTEITSLRKVPGLGDVPLIGGLFRDSSASSQTTNLYLVITPHVVKPKSR
ncbi:MAG: type II secretion system protein GspD [bacterium]|nr:type II secretion system protein GspD [bacterium]